MQEGGKQHEAESKNKWEAPGHEELLLRGEVDELHVGVGEAAKGLEIRPAPHLDPLLVERRHVRPQRGPAGDDVRPVLPPLLGHLLAEHQGVAWQGGKKACVGVGGWVTPGFF